MLDIETLLLPGSNDVASGPRHAPVRRLALIGNALPRKCGLATFTSHVADALRTRYPGLILDHYAIDDGTGVAYPETIETIRVDEIADYRNAAGQIEESGAGAIWLQHEFGIFGGESGAHILELLNSTSVPVIATLHTVLDNPSASERAVFERLLARVDHLVVMASHGAEILRRVYGLADDRFTIIPHGVPDRPLRDPENFKTRFGWQGHRVLMTFGLLAPDKGIQHMIEAMPAIVEAHPDVLYAVVGATHPNLVRQEGERYRESLVARAVELGVADHLRFIDAFVEQEELLDMLQASDVYITPYLNMAQVTSGTLSYAVAVGKPVVSTPYMHARELLADDHGVIVEPAQPAALAQAVAGLLDDDRRRAAVARRAYGRGRTMLWPRVVERALAPLSAGTRHVRHRGARRTTMLPLTAIEQMSDSCGIFQHAIHNIADRRHGYCIDDNARALMLAVRRGRDEPEGRLATLASTYAAFLQHGWNEDRRRYRNFMSFERAWLEPVGSEDSNGRTMWALGVTAAQSPWSGLRDWAKMLFEHSGRAMGELDACRARTFVALGAYAMLEREPGHAMALDMMRSDGDCLMAQYDHARRDGWEWFEADLAYDNARLCEGLLKAGQVLGDKGMIEVGLATLDWLVAVQTGPRGSFRPVGSNGFGRPYAMPLAYDQQPLEAAATIDAAAAAFTITGDERWEGVARDAFGWFFGDNDGGIPLADVATGGCYDGLMATGVNRNQGAESILALHLSALTVARTFGAQRTGQEHDGAAKARLPILNV